MSKAIFGIPLTLLVFIIFAAIVFMQEEPANLQFTIKNCLGGNICWVGQTITLGINFNSKNSEINGIEKLVDVHSVDGSVTKKNITIGKESEIKIPISTALSEGNYKLSISSELVNTTNFLLSLKRQIQDFFRENKYTAVQDIKLKYPVVKVESAGYKCNDNGFYFEEIKLKLEDPYFTELDCRLRVYVDKFIKTNHDRLTKREYTDQFDYYESNYSKINKLDLSGAVQKVSFFAGPAVQKTNTRIVPVCLIEGKDIEIITQERKIEGCSVNR